MELSFWNSIFGIMWKSLNFFFITGGFSRSILVLWKRQSVQEQNKKTEKHSCCIYCSLFLCVCARVCDQWIADPPLATFFSLPLSSTALSSTKILVCFFTMWNELLMNSTFPVNEDRGVEMTCHAVFWTLWWLWLSFYLQLCQPYTYISSPVIVFFRKFSLALDQLLSDAFGWRSVF